MSFITESSESESLDVDVLLSGDRMSVIAGPILCTNKWRGGVWVQYITSTESDFVVEISDGNETMGFLPFPSENYEMIPPTGSGPGSNNNYLAAQNTLRRGGQNVVATMTSGGRFYFKIYETQRLVMGARTGAAVTYVLNEDLKVSENGLLCNDSDVDLATVGIAVPIVVGIVSAVPATRNNNRLGFDLKY